MPGTLVTSPLAILPFTGTAWCTCTQALSFFDRRGIGKRSGDIDSSVTLMLLAQDGPSIVPLEWAFCKILSSTQSFPMSTLIHHLWPYGLEPPAGAGPSTQFGKGLEQQASRNEEKVGSRFGRGFRSHRPDLQLVCIEGPRLAPPLDPSWPSSAGFKLVEAGRWRWPSEHINMKEARVSVMAV